MIFGYLEDNAYHIAIGNYLNLFGLAGYNFIGFPHGPTFELLKNTQPLTFTLYYLLSILVNPVVLYNLFILTAVVLNIISSYIFFRSLSKGSRLTSSFAALVFAFNPFLLYAYQSHMELSQLWVLVFFITLLFRQFNISTQASCTDNAKLVSNDSVRKIAKLGFLTSLIFLVCNYYGAFALILFGATCCGKLLTSTRKFSDIKQIIKYSIVYIATFIATLVIPLYSYFLAPFGKNLNSNPNISFSRPIGDFYRFSWRPWYSIVPPIANPFYGKVAAQLFDETGKIGDFLKLGYFRTEHAAAYIGLTLMIILTVQVFKYRKKYKGLLIISIFIILLVTPPTADFLGLRIPMPGYILYFFMPIFRVTVRLMQVVLLFSFIPLLDFLSERRSKTLLPIVIFATILTEFIVPIKITNLAESPDLGIPKGTPTVVYPYSKAVVSSYWLSVNGIPLINPRDFTDNLSGFNSEEFSKNLLDTAQLETAKLRGAEYLVVINKSNADEIKISNLIENNIISFHKQIENNKSRESRLFFGIRYLQIGNLKDDPTLVFKIL